MTPTPTNEDGERPRLSKVAVVDRALKLADAEGLDALTIRKLAQDLGVTPMALYWHFRSKDELLDGLAERVWSEIDVRVEDSLPWSARLRVGLESLIVVLRAHPCAPQLLLGHEKRSESGLRAADTTLEILLGAGFDPPHAVEIMRSALWTAIMLVMSEPGHHPGKSDEENAEDLRRTRIEFSLLPVDKFPRLVEFATLLTDCNDPEFHYRVGVDMFIAGVASLPHHP
jgi:TetR/AcrR family transcriptional regulator, tetracycline repressor protein